MSDLDRAREIIEDAREYDERMHVPAETAGRHIRALVALARAGLELRESAESAIRGHEAPALRSNAVGDAISAYDDQLRAALPPEPGGVGRRLPRDAREAPASPAPGPLLRCGRGI